MHYLNLPGEIRNEVYHALLHSSTTTDDQKPKQLNQPSNNERNNTTTLRLSAAGVLIPPTLAHTNALIRHELCSLLEHKTTTAPSVVLEAQAIDFDVAPLHAFLLKHHSHGVQTAKTQHQQQQTTTVKLTLHLTSPHAASSSDNEKYAALRAFLQDSQSRGWSVGYRVKFDWTRFSIGDAAESAKAFERAFISGGEAGSGNAGEGLWRALKKARETEVRRCLVERPSRQRALMVEGRGRGMME
jgi:hypothetical protein